MEGSTQFMVLVVNWFWLFELAVKHIIMYEKIDFCYLEFYSVWVAAVGRFSSPSQALTHKHTHTQTHTKHTHTHTQSTKHTQSTPDTQKHTKKHTQKSPPRWEHLWAKSVGRRTGSSGKHWFVVSVGLMTRLSRPRNKKQSSSTGCFIRLTHSNRCC